MLWDAVALAILAYCGMYFLFSPAARDAFADDFVHGRRGHGRGWRTRPSRLAAVLLAAAATVAVSKAVFHDAYFLAIVPSAALWQALILVLAEEVFFRFLARRLLGVAGQAAVYALIFALAFAPGFGQYLLMAGFLFFAGSLAGIFAEKFGLRYALLYRLAVLGAYFLSTVTGSFLVSTVLLLLPFAYHSLKGGREFSETAASLGLGPVDPGALVIHAALLFAATLIAIAVLTSVLARFGIEDAGKVANVVEVQNIAALLIAVSLAPVAEEVFFRGFLNRETGILLSSILFGAAHYVYGSVVEVAAAVVLGLVLAAYVRKSGSLYAPFAVHAAYNLLTIISLMR